MTDNKKLTCAHIVLDIETASTKPNAAVLSIGAAVVLTTLEEGEYQIDCNDKFSPFYRHLNLADCLEKGLHQKAETMAWWDKQLPEVRKEAFKGEENSLFVLQLFAEWIKSYKDTTDVLRIYGNGADFDPVVMESCLEAFGVPVPWTYKEVRCLRTFIDCLSPRVKEQFHGKQDEKTKHIAVYDALHEAKLLCNILEGTIDINPNPYN